MQLPTPPGPIELVLGDREGDREWATIVIAPALGGVPSASRAPEWWGTGRLGEVVAYPAPTAELAQRTISGLDLITCGWCETGVVALPCPFCGHAG